MDLDLGKGVRLRGNTIVYERKRPTSKVTVKKKLTKKLKEPIDFSIDKSFKLGNAIVNLSGALREGTAPDEAKFKIIIPFKKGGKI